MICVMSDAKSIVGADVSVVRSSCLAAGGVTVPHFLTTMTADLITACKKLKLNDVKRILKISDTLAQVNYNRYQHFVDTGEMVKACESTNFSPTVNEPNEVAPFMVASFAYDGPAFRGLQAHTLSPEEFAGAKDRIRILSGLHGLLRPSDVIQPYRLCMDTKNISSSVKNLYSFWGNSVAKRLNAELSALSSMDGTKKGGGSKIIVNCASNEYWKAVNVSEAFDGDVHIVECVFRTKGKVSAAYAKRARGLFARWLVQRVVQKASTRTLDESLTEIKAFDVEGYTFRKDEHDGQFHKVIFDRDVIPATPKEGDDEEEASTNIHAKSAKAGRRDEAASAGAAPAKKAKK